MIRAPSARATAAIAAALIGLAACGDQAAGLADAGADAAPTPGQGSEPNGDLVLNEIAVRPTSGPDWFEIANRGDAAIDLCGYFATDLLDRLDHYLALGGAAPPDACAPRLLGPHEYLVVYADDAAEVGHAPFQLGQADEIHLGSWSTGRSVDGLLYLDIAASDQSLARTPDAAGLFYPAEPTPGESNPEAAP